MGLNTSRFLDFSPMAREVEEKRRGGKMEVGSKEWKGPSKKRKISEESRTVTRTIQN